MPNEKVYSLADLENWRARSGEEQVPIRLGVLGDPIAHSRSPQIQNAALRSVGLPLQYARFRIGANELERALRLLPRLNFVGVNLTIPHKIAGAQIVDEVEEFAAKIGAINTVRVEGEKLVGSNTDGTGFARAIRSEFSMDLRGLRVLLIGAGGAARAIAMQCAVESCERLVVVNRTVVKAKQLVAELQPLFADAPVSAPVPRLEALPLDDRALQFQIAKTDLLVNATPIGLRRSDRAILPASWLAPHLMVYDTVYSSGRTPLLKAAAEAGARGANGLSMLLHQGALAFETWFDRAAPLEAMRAALDH